MTTMHPEHPVGPNWTPEEPDALSVLVANVYVGNRRLDEDLALFERLDPDVVGVSEGWKIRDVSGYGLRSFQTWEDGRYSAEVPILTTRRGGSDRVRLRGSRWVRGAKGVPGSKVAHPRWIGVVRLEKGGRRFSIVNTHMHATIVGPDGRPFRRAERVRQYRRHMKRLLRVVREERAAGFEPIVVGDLNYPPRGKPWRWKPSRALARVGLSWVCPRLDGFGADPEVFEWTFEKVEPKGSDHDHYVLARLRWRT